MSQIVEAVDMRAMGARARQAAYALASLSRAQKDQALLAIADALHDHSPTILQANQRDMAEAEARGTDSVWLRDRIDLSKRLPGIIADVRHVATLPDPVGQEYGHATLPSGISVRKRRVPLGVLGVIYESRPNVTVDVAVLALKTGNACIMRGGSDTLNSNLALLAALHEALASQGITADAVQAIPSTDRRYVAELLRLHEYVDLIIPRGGASLHDFCRQNSTIPVIIGGMGICHLYVDPACNLDAAMPVIANAKLQRPAVCNALDTLLVHEARAVEVLPRVVTELGAQGVRFKAEPRALALVGHLAGVEAAQEGDFDTEWMALTLGLKVVADMDEAIAHIRQHSQGHSDGILTDDPQAAERFLNLVDSAAVFWNASTRFNDGGALGLGAEVAISTQKMHARGPLALEELTTYKWIVVGQYTSRP